MKILRRVNESIIASILLPIVAIAAIVSVIAVNLLTSSFDSFQRDQIEADLKLATQLGVDICEERLQNLLALRLENDPKMMAAARNQAREEIIQISKKFHKIHLLIIKNQQTIEASSLNFPQDRVHLPEIHRGDSPILTANLWGEPILFHYQYFPLWRWHIISYIQEKDYAALTIFTQRFIYLAVLVGVAIILLMVLMVFYARVELPLKNLLRTTVAVGRGEFVTVAVKRRDEIGQVSQSFNEMVENLRAAHQALRNSEATLQSLFRAAPIGIGLLHHRVFLFANEQVSRMTGYSWDELNGQNARMLYATEAEFQRVGTVKYQAIREHGTGTIETQWLHKDGRLIEVLLSSSFINPNDPEAGTVFTALDITERKQAQEELSRHKDHLEELVAERTAALTESEARYRVIFEGATIGIVLRGLDGKILAGNPAYERTLGYDQEELSRLGWSFLHSEDAPRFLEQFRELANGRRDSFTIENRAFHKDGHLVWGRVKVSRIKGKDERGWYALSLIEDITAEKQLQAEIATYQERLRALASELTLAEEKERRRLAEDLHDHIGQVLALTQIKLGALKQELNRPQVIASLDEIRGHINQVIHATRSLTLELGFRVLDELGLEAGIEWLGEKYQEQHGLKIDVEWEPLQASLNSMEKTLLFRMVRELLTNVVKHARADHAKVSLKKEGEALKLTVADNGIGLEVANLTTLDGFGLFSISERVGNLGGQLNIESTPDHGAQVSITLPLQKKRVLTA